MVKKNTSYNFKYRTDINNEVDVKKILISGRVSYGKKGFKYLIGYQDDDKIKPLCIMLPELTEYVKCFDETKYM